MERLSADILLKIFFLFLLLLLSGFFSGSETSLFSLGRIERYRLRHEDETLAVRWIHELLGRPRRLLITILIGNECVNITISALSASLTEEAFSAWGVVWKTLATTALIYPLVLVLGEITPKTVAIRYPQGFARLAVFPLYLFSRLVSPLRYLLWQLSNGIVRVVLGRSPDGDPALTEREFRSLVDLSREGGALWASEHRFIHNIFDFGETRVSELMTPRTDMVCLQTGRSFQEVMEVIRENLFSRIPVYEKDKDDIVGILYSKDLLNDLLKTDRPEGWSLRGRLRTPYFIPQTKKADDLFREFRSNRIHMAIVVDEYGGVAGLVTMEDLLVDLFGEILDEYDPEEPRVRQVDEHTVILPGRMSIEDFNQRFHASLPEEEYDTMAGMVFDLFGKLPSPGAKVSYMHYTFTVEKMLGTRIVELCVHRDPGVGEAAKKVPEVPGAPQDGSEPA
jgi:putative hemolysin